LLYRRGFRTTHVVKEKIGYEMNFFISKKGGIKMKKTIASVSLAMLMCFGFMGLQQVGSTTTEESAVVVEEETANVTAPAEAVSPAEEAAPDEEAAPVN
jgi:hypothetical protein